MRYQDVPQAVVEQLVRVRATGKVNMFDARAIYDLAVASGWTALAEWMDQKVRLLPATGGWGIRWDFEPMGRALEASAHFALQGDTIVNLDSPDYTLVEGTATIPITGDTPPA